MSLRESPDRPESEFVRLAALSLRQQFGSHAAQEAAKRAGKAARWDHESGKELWEKVAAYLHAMNS